MTFKLALRNIRRTLGDYAVYFITIVLGVAVFYAFNSVESQKVLLDIQESGRTDIFDTTQEVLSMVSYAIAFVLGFLVIYANGFLIRRRKREFGTYLVLGMSPRKVAFIVLVETVLVGIVALAVGLGLGILLSQGLAFATAALFGTTISDYHFVFSEGAFIATLVSFAVVYVVVAIFNVASVSRFKLIDLLHADKRSQRTPVRNPWVCLAVFVVAVAMIAYSYMVLIEDGMLEFGSPLFIRATIFMLVGSLLFFWSLAGFLVGIISKLNGLYLRGIVPFTVRQFAAKINTAWVSLWATCIMLFLTITIFSTGMGMINVFVGNIDRATLYDATFSSNPAAVMYEEEALTSGVDPDDVNPFELGSERYDEMHEWAEEYDWNMLAYMEDNLPHWDEYVKDAAEQDTYRLNDIVLGDLFDAADVDWRNEVLKGAATFNLEVIALSQYNDTMALAGEPPLELADDQYGIDNTLSASQEATDAVVEHNVPIEIAGQTLYPSKDIQCVNLSTSSMDSTAFAVIVPDGIVDKLKAQGMLPVTSYVNANYYEEGFDTDNLIGGDLRSAFPIDLDPGIYDAEELDIPEVEGWKHNPWPVFNFYTKAQMREQSGGLRMLITYLALYIGFVLLVATAAILAIQQLTESVDSLRRYHMLWRLGCGNGMLMRSLFVQVLVYFLTPLVLAVAHAGCAISVLADTMFSALGGQDMLTPILMAAGFTLVVYGCYLLVTFLASRRVVKGALRASAV